MSRRTESTLREMGLAPLWKLRVAEEVQPEQPAPPVQADPAAPAAPRNAPKPVAREPDPGPYSPEARGARLVHSAVPADIAPSAATPGELAGMDWDALQQSVAECQACGLCKQRRQAVFGVGDRQADWLFVGEGPGADEDERGEPFVGVAGKLLDAMLAAIHLRRGDNVYIANAVKCRPPGNRTPEVDEAAACFPFLERQIALIRPRLIVALGRPAAQTLLGTEVKIGAVRGRLLDFRGIPLIVTYHPAYLLRNLPDKSKAWEDLCFARRTMAGLRR
ncbi:MAG: uracil-DNA glycosylase [Rhodocyclaceae bacterium]|nr:uracil-DNA glycosylase [Rhodocyclaceae bacterium]